jgi:DNA polymerase
MSVIAWPESPAPPEVLGCDRCELARQRTRVIWGEGNPLAPVMIILDNPGAREDREGRAFVCSTRLTLRDAMLAARMDPDQAYLTYLLKCRPIRKYDKEAARNACLSYLEHQIAALSPRILVCLGDVVAKTLVGPESSVKQLRSRVNSLAGIPAVFSYHPLAARRRPNLLPYLVSDLTLAAAQLRADL